MLILTPQQIAFFNVFGFLVLRNVFDEAKIRHMSHDFDAIAYADRDGGEFKGEKRQSINLQNTESFRNLFFSDEFYYPLNQLLGDGFIGGDARGIGGGIFVGDTQWHPDIPEVHSQQRIKLGMYLDPVRKNTGSLMVVPGSHKNPLHELLQPLKMGRLREALVDGRLLSNIAPASEEDRAELEAWEKRSGVNLDDNDTIFGWAPTQIPSTVFESNPGDVVLFSQYIFHASFGGWDGRRM